MRNWALRTGVRAGVVLGCIIIIMLAANAQKASMAGHEIYRQQALALAKGGLHAAASITGSYLGEVRSLNVGGPASLNELASYSHLVVVGTPMANASRLTPDGQSINIWYRVEIESILKGELSGQRQQIDVLIPGGKVGFPDGTWAQLRTRGFKLPAQGQRHIWFLRKAQSDIVEKQETKDGCMAYEPSRGPLGIYELSSEHSIRPSGNYRSPLALRMAKEKWSVDEFLKAVEKAIAK